MSHARGNLNTHTCIVKQHLPCRCVTAQEITAPWADKVCVDLSNTVLKPSKLTQDVESSSAAQHLVGQCPGLLG